VRGSRASLAEPPAELPSTMYSSHSSGSFEEQSRACRAARRRRAPTCAGGLAGVAGGLTGPRRLQRLLHDRLASEGCSSSHSASLSLVARSTSDRIGTLPSLPLVWPSNCGSLQLHRDDRGEPLADVLALEVGVLLLEGSLGRAYLLTVLVRAFLKPSSCMPPSMVVMPLAKECMPSVL
jgi:hypothetical protein